MESALNHGFGAAIRLLADEGADPDARPSNRKIALWSLDFATVGHLITKGANTAFERTHRGDLVPFLHHLLTLAVPKPQRMPPLSWYLRMHLGVPYDIPVASSADPLFVSALSTVLLSIPPEWISHKHEKTGLTPLHLALLGHDLNPAVIEMILAAGGYKSVNQPLKLRSTSLPSEWLHTEGVSGCCPLHLAVCLKASTQEIVDMLVGAGADPDVKDASASPRELNKKLGGRFVLPL